MMYWQKVVFFFFDNILLLFVYLFTSSKLDFYIKSLWVLLNLKGWQEFLGRGMFYPFMFFKEHGVIRLCWLLVPFLVIFLHPLSGWLPFSGAGKSHGYWFLRDSPVNRQVEETATIHIKEKNSIRAWNTSVVGKLMQRSDLYKHAYCRSSVNQRNPSLIYPVYI